MLFFHLNVTEYSYLEYKIQALHVRTGILEEYHTRVMRVKFFEGVPPDSFGTGWG